jgi:epoxyqueuosine reductase
MSASAPAAERVKAQAYALGFDLAGIAPVGPAPTAGAFDQWLARGYAGTMSYLGRGAEPRRDPSRHIPRVRSAIVVAMTYGGTQPGGPVARYARGRDYHDVLREKLQSLHRWLEEQTGAPVAARSHVDTGPILERDLARQAGLGWFGKNTMLINPRIGSFFFIGALFVDLELERDTPFEADRCGTCTRCIEACPTNAIVEPRVLDARRCISYLTIELREGIPEELRPLMGDLLFGCDICQDVCPWNVSFAKALPDESPYAPREVLAGTDARGLARAILAMDEEAYRAAFRGSPMKRATLRGLKRNAAVVLGNAGAPGDEDVLSTALDDPEALVREHALWALAVRAKGESPAAAAQSTRPADP